MLKKLGTFENFGAQIWHVNNIFRILFSATFIALISSYYLIQIAS